MKKSIAFKVSTTLIFVVLVSSAIMGYIRINTFKKTMFVMIQEQGIQDAVMTASIINENNDGKFNLTSSNPCVHYSRQANGYIVRCSIVDKNSTYLYQSEQNSENSKLHFPQAEAALKSWQDGGSEPFLLWMSGPDGKSYHLRILAPIIKDGSYIGAVELLLSTSRFCHSVMDTWKRYAAVIFILMVLILGLFVILTQRALRPLKLLDKTIENLNAGGKTEKLSIRSGDEIESLAANIDNLMDNWQNLIDEREQQKNEALSQSKFNDAVVQNIANGIIALDNSGKIARINRAAETNLGLSPETVMNKPFENFFPSWEGEDCARVLKTVLENGEPYSNERVYFKSPFNNREVVFNININPFFDNKNNLQGAISLFEFLTDKVVLEEHLLKTNEELKRANQIKSDFLSTVSHELRTPLTLIKMYTSMLEERKLGEMNEKQAKAVEVMSRRCKNLNDLIDDLLDLSRIESRRMELNMEAVSLESILKEIQAIFLPRINPERILFTVAIAPGMPDVFCDRDKIVRALNNLVENAFKFTETGSVEIWAATDETTPAMAKICVKDTGRGIPEEQQEQVFDKFYQVDGANDRRFGGIGLGLSIARDIIILHGGHLWLQQSKEGEGSLFCFAIPFYTEKKDDRFTTEQTQYETNATGQGLLSVESSRRDPLRKAAVLIIDDDPDFIDVMKDILEDDGFEVSTASTGADAFPMLFSTKRFDIVLLDVAMPGMTGYEVCRALKSFETTKEIPVVMLTAAGQSEQISAGFEAGAAGYLVKPFDLSDFRKTLNRVLGGQ
jgi:PAS domain S-box-containing protein